MKNNKLYFEYMRKIWIANKLIAKYSNPKSGLTPEQITGICTMLQQQIQLLEFEMCKREIEPEDDIEINGIPWHKEKFQQYKKKRKYSTYSNDDWHDFDYVRVGDRQLTINY